MRTLFWQYIKQSNALLYSEYYYWGLLLKINNVLLYYLFSILLCVFQVQQILVCFQMCEKSQRITYKKLLEYLEIESS